MNRGERYLIEGSNRYRKYSNKLIAEIVFSSFVISFLFIVIFLIYAIIFFIWCCIADKHFYLKNINKGICIIFTMPLAQLILQDKFFNYFGLFLFHRRYKTYYHTITKILDENIPFCLYLREFKSGQDLGYYFSNLNSMRIKHGNKRIGEIENWIKRRKLPIIYIDNIKELTHDLPDLPFYSNDEYWFEDFKYLASKSKLILFDYGDEYLISDNIKKEIDFVKNLNKEIIVILDKSESKSKLLGIYPELNKKIKFLQGYNNMRGDWHSFTLKETD
jgi:hypothetical protein